MTSFFPDLNIWLALSVQGHVHNAEAWDWMNQLPPASRIAFSRYTQIGLLRLLTNESVMGQHTLTLQKAWSVYDRWIDDPRVEFRPEPRDLDSAFRDATASLSGKPASKWIGDCFLLAYAKCTEATLVTFDRALYGLAKREKCPACVPGKS